MIVSHITAQANSIGKEYGVVCGYEWDRKKKCFRWNYYRHGHFVRGTARMDDVIPVMNRLVTAK